MDGCATLVDVRDINIVRERVAAEMVIGLLVLSESLSCKVKSLIVEISSSYSYGMAAS